MSYTPTNHAHVDQAGFVVRLETILSALVALWVFSGAFVMVEPSGFEILLPAVLGFAMLSGLKFYRGSLFVLITGTVFTLFGFVANFNVVHTEAFDVAQFMAVSGFLAFTSFFLANYIAQKPLSRIQLIFNAYCLGAVITATLGILGYFGMIPGAENFVLYGRAKGAFKDPNVYAPFLMLPVGWLVAQLILNPILARPFSTLMRLGALGIIMLGVFLSFSRAGWGHLLLTGLITVVLVFSLQANASQAKRLFGFILVGAIVGVVGLLALLSNEAVSSLFETRASAVQNYDSGPQGRFGRQAGIFWQILENPFGLGVFEFSFGSIAEEPHNTYFKVFLDYGWIGGGAFIALVIGTFIQMGRVLKHASPLRLPMIVLAATFIPLMLEAMIIDIDHWRHFYLITGLIWGLSIAQRIHRSGVIMHRA